MRKRAMALFERQPTTLMRAMSMASKKRNALKHGANAKEVMLWSERYEDYEALRADLYLEFTPSGSTEEYLVRALLDLRWRRRRLDCHEQITIQKRLDEIPEVNENSRCRLYSDANERRFSTWRRDIRLDQLELGFGVAGTRRNDR